MYGIKQAIVAAVKMIPHVNMFVETPMVLAIFPFASLAIPDMEVGIILANSSGAGNK